MEDKKMSEKITVVIPVFNTEKYLDECLDSVCNQTYKNLQILCVFTESKDNSLNILKTISLFLSFFIYVQSLLKILQQKDRKCSP